MLTTKFNSISPIELLEIISSYDIQDEIKLSHIQNLKTHIKKDTIDLRNVPIYLQIITKGLEITRLNISSVSFNSLSYLIKRISVQDKSGNILKEECFLILPILINKLGNASSPAGTNLAKKSLEDYWLSSPIEVEDALTEIAFENPNTKITIETIDWMTQILKNISAKFNVPKFLPKILHSIEINPHNEEIIVSTKELLSIYLEKNPSAIEGFKKQIESHLLAQATKDKLLGSVISKLRGSDPEPHVQRANTPRLNTPVSQIQSSLVDVGHDVELLELLNKVNYEIDSSIKALDIRDANNLFNTFEIFMPCFDGKETESNWKVREKNILQMRSILRGNSATQFRSELVQCIHTIANGMCKGASSLRTTLSSNSCQLIKECAVILKKSLEPVAESLFPTLIKLCSSTKNIASTNANMSVAALYANLPYTSKMIQRITLASEDRNYQPRSYSLIWLHILLLKIGIDRSYIGHHDSSFIEAANKVFMKLLKDANPNVRQTAKECYWCFTRVFPEDAERLLKRLEPNIVRALERSQRESGGSGIAPIRTLSSRPSRPSLKEAILEKNKELRQRRPPSRNSGEQSTKIKSVPLPRPTKSSSRLEKSLLRPDVGHKSQPAVRASSWTYPSTQSGPKATFKQRERSKTEVHKKSPLEISRPSSRLDTGAVSSFNNKNDPMINFLSSSDSDLIKEGINLLKYAIIGKENLPSEINSLLKSISEKHVQFMKPLFTSNDYTFKKAALLLLPDDFLRVCALVFDEFDEAVISLIIQCIDVLTFYESACNLLTLVADTPNIPGSHALVMQISNQKLTITKLILQALLIALSKHAVTDVQFGEIFQELVKLIIVLKATDYYSLLCQLFRQLYTIDSNKFSLLVEDVEGKLKEEVEFIVGIESTMTLERPSSKLDYDLTVVKPTLNLGTFVLSQKPSADDFTMLLPKRSEFLGSGEVHNSKMVAKIEALDSSPQKQSQMDQISLKRSNSEHQSEVLVDDFANVSIADGGGSKLNQSKNDDDNLKQFMERIDPLKPISNKIRKISIYEDAKQNSEKPKLERNWGGFQYAKFSRAIRVNAVAENMSLTSQEFESCCSKLVETPSQSALLKMTWFVDSLSVSSYDYQEFFLNKGKHKLEKSLWEFFSKIDKLDHSLVMNGLFLLKQLLKFNDTPNVDKLFALLVDTCSQEELDSELYFIWNEMLLSLNHDELMKSFEKNALNYLEGEENNLTILSLCLNYLAKVLVDDNCLDVAKIYRLDTIFGKLFHEREVMFRKSATICYSNLLKNTNVSPEVKDTLDKVKSRYPASTQRLIEFYMKR